MKWWKPFVHWLVQSGADIPKIQPSQSHIHVGDTSDGNGASVGPSGGADGLDDSGFGFGFQFEPREMTNGRGVGLVATQDLPKDTLLFAIPPSLLILGPDRFELAEWLFRARMLAEDDEETCDDECKDDYQMENEDDLEFEEDKWKAYINTLPSLNEPERMPTLNPYYEAVIKNDFSGDKQIADAIDFAPYYVKDMKVEAEWLLSLALVSSRIHIVWVRDHFGDWVTQTAMVPLADLLNGLPVYLKNVGINVQCETRKKDAHFICKTTQPVSMGEELLVQYGNDKASAKDIEETYGFRVDENDINFKNNK